jgi:sulfoquinovose isomerase
MLYIFDLGNVIVDIDFNRVLGAWSDLTRIPLASLKKSFHMGEAFHQHERGEISDEAFAEALCHEMALPLSYEQFSHGWQAVFVALRPEVIAIMHKLREQGHRVIRVASVIIHDVARNNHYRVNEHFDTQWNPLPDYNKDNPAHRFRAFGGTPGHWIEWGRLMLHIHAALEARCEQPPAWLLEDAKGLFNATVRDAWAPDGADGIVYTVDWEGKPVVRERVRWPIVEAMGTAYALYTVTGDRQYETWYQTWWEYCIKYLMDYENGSWWQELDADNKVTTKVWDGKQDIYHLLHCLVIPRIPLAPGMAPAVAVGLLDINAK